MKGIELKTFLSKKGVTGRELAQKKISRYITPVLQLAFPQLDLSFGFHRGFSFSPSNKTQQKRERSYPLSPYQVLCENTTLQR